MNGRAFSQVKVKDSDTMSSDTMGKRDIDLSMQVREGGREGGREITRKEGRAMNDAQRPIKLCDETLVNLLG